MKDKLAGLWRWLQKNTSGPGSPFVRLAGSDRRGYQGRQGRARQKPCKGELTLAPIYLETIQGQRRLR